MVDLSSASIVFVDNYPHVSVGGGEHHLLRVADACARAGARTHVMCAPGSGLELLASQHGHAVVPVMMSANSLSTATRMRCALADLKPTIVHMHGFFVTAVGAAGAAASGARAVLATVHAMPSAPVALRPDWRGRFEFAARSFMTRRAARHLDRIVCVVDAARAELEAMGVAGEKLVVIPNGIPAPAGQVIASDSPDAPPLVGSVGRLESPKGYEYLVDAAALVGERVPDVRVRLVGDGVLRGALGARVVAAGLDGRVELAGWSDEPLAEIAAMDVYVVSSVTETTNLTVLEAMALGKPVVVTNVGGLPEVVEDGVTGLVVPPRDPGALADAVVSLLGDPELRARMGAAGRERFLERFTVERMTDAHLELYAELLGGE
jgi:glycosyltransferase involved in cell wall biosynthesis